MPPRPERRGLALQICPPRTYPRARHRRRVDRTTLVLDEQSGSSHSAIVAWEFVGRCSSIGESYGPLPACPAGEAVRQLGGRAWPFPRPLPAGPAGEAVQRLRWLGALACELLHLPDQPAGVEWRSTSPAASP